MGDTITYNQHSTNIEGMNDISCPSNSNSSSSKSIDKFELAWCDFYDKVNSWASPSSASSNTSDSSECDVVVENSKIKEDGLKWLGTINKLLFGQIEDRKSYATNYGIGVLELILKVYEKCAVNTESGNDEELLLSTLKALKSCVVKNASGRRRCRRAQVMTFLENMLKECNSQKLVEEAFTLLSALSMNDDLNTWQASEELSTYIQSLSLTYNSSQTIRQLSTYLLSLFKTIPTSLQVPHPKFFSNLAQAENVSNEGDIALDEKQYGFAEGKYTTAFNLATNYSSDNPDIIHTYLAQVLCKRGICRIETGYVESALEDAKQASIYNENTATRVKVMALVKSDRSGQIREEVPNFNATLFQLKDDDPVLAKLWSDFIQSNQEVFNSS